MSLLSSIQFAQFILCGEIRSPGSRRGDFCKVEDDSALLGPRNTVETARRFHILPAKFRADDVHEHPVGHSSPLLLPLEILCSTASHERHGTRISFVTGLNGEGGGIRADKKPNHFRVAQLSCAQVVESDGRMCDSSLCGAESPKSRIYNAELVKICIPS